MKSFTRFLLLLGTVVFVGLRWGQDSSFWIMLSPLLGLLPMIYTLFEVSLARSLSIGILFWIALWSSYFFGASRANQAITFSGFQGIKLAFAVLFFAITVGLSFWIKARLSRRNSCEQGCDNNKACDY